MAKADLERERVVQAKQLELEVERQALIRERENLAKEAELKACVDKLDEVQRKERGLREEHDKMQGKKALAEMLMNLSNFFDRTVATAVATAPTPKAITPYLIPSPIGKCANINISVIDYMYTSKCKNVR